MKRSSWTVFWVVLIAVIGFLSGAGELQKIRSHPKLEFSPLVPGISADRDCPSSHPQSFAIVIYAHNAANWCERTLRSVFEQDYERYRVVFVDDGSVDHTLEKAQEFIIASHQDHRVIAIRNPEMLGLVGSLYRAIDHCQDLEIVVPLDAENWLSQEGVLTQLNQAFQNPDTWLAWSQSIEYPTYRILDPPSFPRSEIEKRGFRSCTVDLPIAFYAGLFKAIHLPDLLHEGSFSFFPRSFIVPLLEQSGGRFRTLNDPFVFVNESHEKRVIAQDEGRAMIQNRKPYHPMTQFPWLSSPEKGGVDLVIFSFDRPLQLFSALESIHRFVSGYQNLSVLYRVSDTRFEMAYEGVKAFFPKAHYIKQSDNPRRDFKPLLLEAVFAWPADYIAFGDDDMIVKDFVDLTFCRQMLEKTGAYSFYLSQEPHSAHKGPASLPLSANIHAWDLTKGQSKVHCLDMAVYRKADLKMELAQLKYKNPHSLLSAWAKLPENHPVGLCFEQSKMVHLPLQAAKPFDSMPMNYMTAEELLVKFNQGFKIDIDPIFQVDNASLQTDYLPEFILR